MCGASRLLLAALHDRLRMSTRTWVQLSSSVRFLFVIHSLSCCVGACALSRTESESEPSVDQSKRVVDLTLDERLEYCEWLRVNPNLRPDAGCGEPDLEPFDPAELPQCASVLIERLPDTCSWTVGDHLLCLRTPLLPPCNEVPRECIWSDDCFCDGEICPSRDM